MRRVFDLNHERQIDCVSHARSACVLIDYRGLRGGFPAFDLATLLAGKVEPAAINDKVVLVGVKAESVPDVFHTPFSSASITGGRIPGVELHASIVRQLLIVRIDLTFSVIQYLPAVSST